VGTVRRKEVGEGDRKVKGKKVGASGLLVQYAVNMFFIYSQSIYCSSCVSLCTTPVLSLLILGDKE